MNDKKIDPFLASVIHGALEDIALEMGQKLMRMSYSSIIRESSETKVKLKKLKECLQVQKEISRCEIA